MRDPADRVFTIDPHAAGKGCIGGGVESGQPFGLVGPDVGLQPPALRVVDKVDRLAVAGGGLANADVGGERRRGPRQSRIQVQRRGGSAPRAAGPRS